MSLSFFYFLFPSSILSYSICFLKVSLIVYLHFYKFTTNSVIFLLTSYADHIWWFIGAIILVIDCWLAFAYFLGFLGMFFLSQMIFINLLLTSIFELNKFPYTKV
ncbi:hypothetical protein ACJX0J_011711, partial [Zea mays]